MTLKEFAVILGAMVVPSSLYRDINRSAPTHIHFTCIHADIHTYIYIYIHTYICTYIHTSFLHTYIQKDVYKKAAACTCTAFYGGTSQLTWWSSAKKRSTSEGSCT